ncbi:hypothetical protein [Pandoraea apista]|uniref:hypothetical protein n=1 Tax=Pandoraea apista TaxID=93218 RepID=UPI0011B0AB84|nr:hypothetical protein [Pandoraea apista]
MSLFPEPKFQKEWLDRCFEFDRKMENLPHLNEEEKSKLLEEFNAEMQAFHARYKNAASN